MLQRANLKFTTGSNIKINSNHFASNLQLIRRLTKQKAKLMLIVKSNAYGHGLKQISQLGLKAKVDFFGVAKPEEAFALRKLKIKKSILLLAPAHPSCIQGLIEANVTFTISSLSDALQLIQYSKLSTKKPRVHFKVDTGMGRFGSRVNEALKTLFQIQKLEEIRLEGAYSHFPDAGSRDNKKVLRQIETFSMLIDLFRELYPNALKHVHLSNSSAVFNYPESFMSMVRVGISAYGVNPGIAHEKVLALKPVLSWESFVTSIKEFQPGQTLSYDRSYTIQHKTQIAVIPVGYASGYPLACSNKGSVLIAGKSYPIVGRITMDFMMVDIGWSSPVQLWDRVIIIGDSQKISIRAEDIAKSVGTIPYDVVCGLSESIPRIVDTKR